MAVVVPDENILLVCGDNNSVGIELSSLVLERCFELGERLELLVDVSVFEVLGGDGIQLRKEGICDEDIAVLCNDEVVEESTLWSLEPVGHLAGFEADDENLSGCCTGDDEHVIVGDFHSTGGGEVKVISCGDEDLDIRLVDMTTPDGTGNPGTGVKEWRTGLTGNSFGEGIVAW
jgi:hypothetical protein